MNRRFRDATSAGAARYPDFAFGALSDERARIAAFGLIIVGGVVEAILLGSFHAFALHRWRPAISRWRWIAATVVVAGLGWAAASASSQATAVPDSASPPLLILMIGTLALGAAMGSVLGLAQAGGLRRVVRRPWVWVAISAIAWAPAMMIIFLGATAPDSSWGLIEVILFGAGVGALAGAVLGLVSGSLAPALDGRSTVNRAVMALLGSPAGFMLSRSTLVLRIRGRVSGTQFALPVQYVDAPDGLVVVPANPERKQWWRNLRYPSRVGLLYRGAWSLASAVVLTPSDERYTRALAAVTTRWPRMSTPTGCPLVLVTRSSDSERLGPTLTAWRRS